jgi:hypothetical protein
LSHAFTHGESNQTEQKGDLTHVRVHNASGRRLRLRSSLAHVRSAPRMDDIMDLFKRAHFLGEFDPTPHQSHSMRFDPTNCLHMEITVL